MSRTNLITAFNKMIDVAKKAKSSGDQETLDLACDRLKRLTEMVAGDYVLSTHENKFVMEIIEETK